MDMDMYIRRAETLVGSGLDGVCRCWDSDYKG